MEDGRQPTIYRVGTEVELVAHLQQANVPCIECVGSVAAGTAESTPAVFEDVPSIGGQDTGNQRWQAQTAPSHQGHVVVGKMARRL